MDTVTKTELDRKVFIEVDRYIYKNILTRTITLLGHRYCSWLRQFDSPGCLVADLGCGTGMHFRYITKANYLGVDIIPEMLDAAKVAIDSTRGQLLKADLFDLPIENNSVDSIISSGVLEHLVPLSKAISESHRILKSGGEFIFLQPCEGPVYLLGRWLVPGRHIKKTLGVDYNKYLVNEHIHSYQGILSELRRFFRIDKLWGVPFFVPNVATNIYIAGRCIKYLKEESTNA